MLGSIRRALCRTGLHKWSPNQNGWRVCLRRGCTAYNPYYGVTGALRWMRERYTEEEIEEMAKHDMEFPLIDRIQLLMSISVVSGTMAIGVWYAIEHVYGNIENPAGAVIRIGTIAGFMILLYRVLPKKKGRSNK